MTVTSQGAPVDDGTFVKLEVPVLGWDDTTITSNGEVSFVVPAATGYLDLQILDATVRVASNFPKSVTLECQSEGAVWIGGITVDDDGITYYTGTAGAIPGPEGPTGPEGPAGPGVPTGGTAGQVLAKIDGTDYLTEWVDPASVIANPEYIYGDSSIVAGLVTGNAKATMIGDSIMNDTNTTFTTLFHAAAFSWKPEKWGGMWHNIAGAFGVASNQSGAVNPVLSIPGDTTSWFPGLASATAGYGRAAESAGTPGRMFDIGFSSDNLSTAAADHNSGVSAKFGDGYGCFVNRVGGRDIATSSNQARLRYAFNFGNDVDYVPNVNINLYNPGSTLNSGFQTTAFSGSGRRMEVVDATLTDTTNYTGSEGGVWQGQVRSINNTERLAVEKQFFGGADDGFTLGYIGDGGWRTRNHYAPGETITTSNGTQAYHYDATYLAQRLAIEGTTHAIVFLGMNDISGADRDGTTVFADLQTVISNLKTARPGVKIVLFTPYNGVLDDAGKIQAKDDLAALIRALPDTDPDVAVYDLRSFIDDSFVSDAAFHAAWLADNTHPNTTGALAMMEDFWAKADEAAFPPTAEVSTVNGQTGAVVLDGNDIETTQGGGTSITDALNIIDLDLAALGQFDNDLLESGGGTSIATGGNFTFSGSTFSVTAGVGHVLDAYTDPVNPTLTTVAFGPFNNVTPSFLNTDPVSVIWVNKLGQLIQRNTAPTPDLFRDEILLGKVYHADLATVSNATSSKVVGPNLQAAVHDVYSALGKLNLDGNVYQPVGANLQFQRTAGLVFDYGANFGNDPKNPNQVTYASENPVSYRRVLQNGTVATTLSTTIDPGQWDNNGTLDSVPSNRYTLQYLYLADTGVTVLMPGQELFNSLARAKDAVGTSNHTVAPNLLETAVFRGILIVRGNCTDLTDTDDAVFIDAGKFGNAYVAGGTTIGSIDDLTDVDTSTVPPTQDANGADALVWNGANWVPGTGSDIYSSDSRGVSISTELAALAIDLITLGAEKVDSVGEGGGTDPIANIVSCTQAEYDALTPVATTVYLITGP
jgi:hypothetical protein